MRDVRTRESVGGAGNRMLTPRAGAASPDAAKSAKRRTQPWSSGRICALAPLLSTRGPRWGGVSDRVGADSVPRRPGSVEEPVLQLRARTASTLISTFTSSPSITPPASAARFHLTP